MPIESSADFNSYVDPNAHGVSATFLKLKQLYGMLEQDL